MPAFPATPELRFRRVRQYAVKSGEAFTLGAAVKLDSTPEIVELAADPVADVLGFTCEANDKDPEANTVLVALAEGDAQFWMAGVLTWTAAMVNQIFAIEPDSDGIWVVDNGDTGHDSVYCDAVDLTRNLGLVHVIAAARQVAP